MSRYNNTKKFKKPRGRIYYGSTKYISPPLSTDDLYVITQEGDSFDSLAQQYYGDSSLWWIISIANNNLTQNSLTPAIGSQIRIPSNPAPIQAEFDILNREDSENVTSNISSGGGSGY